MKINSACTIISVLFLFLFSASAEAMVAPGNLTATAISSSRIKLTWVDTNSGKTGEIGYSVERSLALTFGFVEVGTTLKNITSYNDSALDPGTTYYYRVRAMGRKGTFSPYSTQPAMATTPPYPDTVPPAVSITNPAAGATFITAQTVTIIASASDNVGVTKVEFYDNGVRAGTTASSPYNYEWAFTSTNNGVHHWTAMAYDAAGNSSTSGVVSVTVNISSTDTITSGYEELTPLTFNSKYIVQSATPIATTSSAFVDDSEAVKTFTLNDTQTVLVLYQAHNNESAPLGYWGIGHAISVDGVDHSQSYDTPSIPDQSARNQIFWIGTLGQGEHTVKGRFASPDNVSAVTVSDRILLIYIFDGTGYRFAESSVVRTTSSEELSDDNESVINYFPSENGKALYLYNISKESPGATEWIAGKKAAISVSSVDYSQAAKSTNGGNTMDSVFTLHAENVISHTPITVKGRWASNVNAQSVRMDYSQFGVLFFNDRVLMDFIESDNQVSTTSDPLVDDTEATIQRTVSEDRELLLIVAATTLEGTESERKLNYGISVDSVDRKLSRATSDGVGAFANSAATSWGETVNPGFHIVQGRFSSGGGTAHGGTYVDSRRIVAFWFNNFLGL